MEKIARGSRERSQLRTYVGPGDEHLPTTLEVARGPSNRLQPGLYRYQHSLLGEFGREKGVRRGQASSGVKDSYLDVCPMCI